ncbi:MAG TPA: hypothetical protein VFQ05_18545 [Candidatus Eisenbacteria bacterium]|nr:hypothetical protein [Candidatus Eisenbacteria bacterium]
MRMGPAMRAALTFLGLCLVVTGFGFAQRAGLLDVTTSRRLVGIVIGLMAVVTGNMLPKMRPLGATEQTAATVTASERSAGWIMVFIGLVFVGLFTFAPLELARSLSPIVGLGGIAVIAADWIGVAIWSRRTKPAAADTLRPRRASRMIAAWLVFGVAYLLLMASLRMLTDAAWVREVGMWLVTGFTTVYFTWVALNSGRRTGRS